MRDFVHAAIGSVIVLLQAVSTGATLDGDWVGTIGHREDFVYLQVRFEPETDGFKGYADAFIPPFDFVKARPLTRIGVEGSRVQFQARLRSETFAFDGNLGESAITGVVARGGRSLPFRFDHIAAVNPHEYRGAYDFGGGHLVTFHTAFVLGTNFIGFLDFKTGRTGGLFPISETQFFTGPGALLTHPKEASVRFSEKKNGQWTGAEWIGSGTLPQKGQRVPFREEEVAFTNGSVILRGTLLLPSVGRRRPAVVFAPASTAMATREMARPYAQYFAFHGVACLVYDKRGTGASTGDWLSSDFGELADDALAGVKAVQSRQDIDPRQVGLWGGSQGGWIVALAASRSPDVAFIMSQSGPGVTPEEQELYRTKAWLMADGFNADDINEAMALVRKRYAWSRTGLGWENLSTVDRDARKTPWYPYVGALGKKDNPFWKFWELIRDYDPLPALEKVRCPVLAIFGDRDTFVPVPESILRWKQGLKTAGNNDVTIKVFSNADHSLLETTTGGLKETAYVKRFVPGAFAFQRDWLLNHVKLGQ